MNVQRSHDRKCHIAVAYAIAGLVCALLPVFHRAGVVAEFIALTVVIVLCLCPNGCLLALASAAGRGPAMSLSLAVFNSIANLAGLFGPMLMGSVVHRTCSYDVAFIVLGVVLMLGALLALTVEDSVEECDHAAVLTGLAVEMSTGPEKGGTGYQSAPSISPERSEGNKARGMGSHADMDIADEL
jgi:MFS family permease